MEKMDLFIRDNYIFLYNEIIFDYNDYLKVYENIGSEDDDIFYRLFLKFKIEDKNVVYEYFTDLYNEILINNMANYIMDKVKNCINIENKYLDAIENIIDTKSLISINEILSGILLCILDSKNFEKIILSDGMRLKKNKDQYYQDNNIKDDYICINDNEDDMNNSLFKEKKYIKFFIGYEQEDVKKISNNLKNDLIEFDFIKNTSKDKRYLLPIYIDNDKLIEKGFFNYEDYLPEWISFAYINMLDKIRSYFRVIYGINSLKTFSNDILSVALINLLDYEIKPIPKGVKKSIEKGRQNLGKCFFIDDEIMSVSICNELLISLKAKDVFDYTPKIIKILSN